MDTSEFFFTVCTAGHVDHGKTSIIKRLTGIDPDRLKEEKLRQMTTDLGFAHLSLRASDDKGAPLFKVGFIDVPGHGKFLKNMLAGVGCLDLALLVVAAPEGVMPQTRQHAEILHLLGVNKIIAVITKIDLCSTPETEESEKTTRVLLSDLALDELGMVRVTCTSDTGFERLIDLLRENLSLIAQQRKQSVRSRPVFMPIDRVFKKPGFGIVITGTLARGQLRSDDAVFILPDKVKARVRKMESFGEQVVLAGPGQRLAVNLVLKEEVKLERGSILSGAEIDSRQNLLVVLESPYAKLGRAAPLLASDATVRLYHGTAEYEGSLGWCASEASTLGYPESAIVTDTRTPKRFGQLHIHGPFFGEPGDRVIIRASEDIIVGGTILAKLRPRWMNRASTLEFLERLAQADFEGATQYIVNSDRQKLLHKNMLFEFLPFDVHEAVLRALIEKGKIIELGDFIFSARAIVQLEERIVSDFHLMLEASAEHTSEFSLPLEKLRTAKYGCIDHATFARITDRLSGQGKIRREGEQLFPIALSTSPSSPLHESLLLTLEEKLAERVCIEMVDLAKELDTELEALKRAAKKLENQGKLRIVAHEFISSKDNIARAHEVLEEIWQEKQQISPSAFKERLNITRKYAMPLLSFFDDELITRRVGEGRVLLKKTTGKKPG